LFFFNDPSHYHLDEAFPMRESLWAASHPVTDSQAKQEWIQKITVSIAQRANIPQMFGDDV
jgi:hypothetical protein